MDNNLFFNALGIDSTDSRAIKAFAQASGIPVETLRYFNAASVMPSGSQLDAIRSASGIEPLELQLRLGKVDRRLSALLADHSHEIAQLLNAFASSDASDHTYQLANLSPTFTTKFGELYKGDCMDLLPMLPSDSADMVFADPPFNLKKLYPSGINDDLQVELYLEWCETWLTECIRILKPGGSLFLFNIPRWNSYLAGFLNNLLSFRHWIAVDIKYSLPITGRLYPSHYSLLYYTKGPKPQTFHPDRLPMEVCPECATDLRDYGGYKDKMNPKGVNLTDVWYDIPPVRHAKYKKRKSANELSIRLLDRVIELSTDEGDLIFDPFGGSGTTYAVAEIKRRRWLGIEAGPVDDIIERFHNLKQEADYLRRIRDNYNCLFTESTIKTRHRYGRWTSDSVRAKKLSGERPKERGQSTLPFK